MSLVVDMARSRVEWFLHDAYCMNIPDVSKITRTDQEGDCNALLKFGWRLIFIHTQLRGIANRSDKPGDFFQVFTLGWPRESGEPQYPPHYEGYQDS